MSRLFISHSSANSDKAVEVRDWLAKNGWDDVFLDLIPSAASWPAQRCKEALENAVRRVMGSRARLEGMARVGLVQVGNRRRASYGQERWAAEGYIHTRHERLERPVARGDRRPCAGLSSRRSRFHLQLTDALLEDISGQDALPLLAFTLAHLYDNTRVDNALTLAGDHRIGRVKGVIAKTVEQRSAKLQPEVKRRRRRRSSTTSRSRPSFRILRRCVNPAGQFVRRVAPRDKISDEARPLPRPLRRAAPAHPGPPAGRRGHRKVAHEALLRQPPFSTGSPRTASSSCGATG